MSELSETQLDAARRELARRECAMHGHQFDVVTQMGTGDPRLVLCPVCSRSWPVT